MTASVHTNFDNTNNIRPNINYDTFAQTWGATTQWKTSGRRTERPVSRQDIPDPHLITSHLIATTRSSPLVGKYAQIDKPLPPLPTTEHIELATMSLPKSSQGTAKVATEAENELSKEYSPPQGSTKNNSSTQSRNSSGSSVMGGAKRKSIFGFARRKPKVQPAHPKPPKPLMVDKGTQTTPPIEVPPPPRKPTPTASQSPQPSPHSSRSPRSTKRVHSFFGSTRGKPSPSDGHRTPLWSPRSMLEGTGALDYFGFPSEDVDHTARGISPSDRSTPKASDRHHTSPTTPLPQFNSLNGTSMDTLGTYESRYSPRNSISQSARPRPPLTRSKYSPTSASIRQETQDLNLNHPGTLLTGQLIRPTLRDSAVSFESAPSKRSSQSRPLLQTLQKLSYSRRKSSTRSSSTGTSSTSPLRQEISHPDDATQVPKQYFRQPIFGSVSISGVGTPRADDIPEHLLGSPLCPMHPKHKSGGLGTCPYHGRRQSATDSITGDGEYGDDEKEKFDGVVSVEEEEAEEAFWRDVGGETRKRSKGIGRFRLTEVMHEEGSVLCPAHPRYGGVGKGVCVFHGRGMGRFGKVASDDSVPRLWM